MLLVYKVNGLWYAYHAEIKHGEYFVGKFKSADSGHRVFPRGPWSCYMPPCCIYSSLRLCYNEGKLNRLHVYIYVMGQKIILLF